MNEVETLKYLSRLKQNGKPSEDIGGQIIPIEQAIEHHEKLQLRQREGDVILHWSEAGPKP